MASGEEARRERRIAMFRQVAAERVSKLNLLWIEIERRAAGAAPFLREAHTLKGEASLTGFASVSRVLHAVEDYVKLINQRGGLPAEGDGDVILGGLDLVLKLTQSAPEETASAADAFVAQVTAARGAPLTPRPILSPPPTVPATPPP